jgi:hypothetical protein
MLVVDYVILGIGLLSVLLGAGLGFGKGLKIFTGGIIGKIFTIVVCYFLFGIVASWPFVQSLLGKLTLALEENGNFLCRALLFIRIDMITLAVALFIIVLIIKSLVVGIVASIFEADVTLMRFINKTLGVILFVFMAIVLTLIVFQVIAWINGAYGSFYESIAGSTLRIDNVFVNNPLNAIFKMIKDSFAS